MLSCTLQSVHDDMHMIDTLQRAWLHISEKKSICNYIVIANIIDLLRNVSRRLCIEIDLKTDADRNRH